MPNLVQEAYVAVPLAASALVKTGPGILKGVFVGTTTGLTLKFWDNTSAAGTVVLETTAAFTVPGFHEVPAAFSTGLYVTIGGTGTFTVFYQ